MAKSENDDRKVIARNRRARHDYHILDTWEAGLVLTGPEVKSIRAGKVSLAEAHAGIHRGEVWLYDMHVSPYDPASHWNAPDPRRPRKLLLRRKQIRRLIGAVAEKGLTLVPLDLYFRRGIAKITLALARGKQRHDKREELKRRAAKREVERALRRV